jgi:putative flavoprotein involved in K+ transport
VKVERVARENGNYSLTTAGRSITARNIIVATGIYRLPRIPAFAAELGQNIQQIHSSVYCNPEQVPGRRVLVVGAGNSGAEIALELRNAGKQVWLAGRDVGVLAISGPVARILGPRWMWEIMRLVLNNKTPMGRRFRERMLHYGHPLGRARRDALRTSGVMFTGRVAGTEAGKPRLQDGAVLNVDAVIWATGYRPDFSWIELPIFGEQGWPRHQRGVVPGAPGLYFLGLPFQSAFSSSLVGGVGFDAEYIAAQAMKRGTRP